MIDEKTMRLMVERMESAAEDALRQDSGFYEALQALQWEIDSDPRVQSAISNLQTAGAKVFNSFVPRIKIRVKAKEGVVLLSPPTEVPPVPATEQVGRLTQELRDATSAVIKNSRCRQELESIVNEAIATSDSFEGIASEIESSGYEVVICLDFSAYAQVRECSTPRSRLYQMRTSSAHRDPLSRLLSVQDLKFLEALKIQAIQDQA